MLVVKHLVSCYYRAVNHRETVTVNKTIIFSKKNYLMKECKK
jgi:hypothetical protein